jgi:hypothetical protein
MENDDNFWFDVIELNTGAEHNLLVPFKCYSGHAVQVQLNEVIYVWFFSVFF